MLKIINFTNLFLKVFALFFVLLLSSCGNYNSSKNLSVIGVNVSSDAKYLKKYKGYKFHVCANSFQINNEEFYSYSSGISNILSENHKMHYVSSMDKADLLVIVNYTSFENQAEEIKGIDKYFMKISILDNNSKKVVFSGEAESSHFSSCPNVFHCLYSSILGSDSFAKQKNFVSCLIN